VYSSLSFFGPYRGGTLPGRWFVAALGRVGHAPAAVRQTLWRMERSGELTGRPEGRQRVYRFTPLARAEAGLGLARIRDPLPDAWDGRWTIVHLRFGVGRRMERERTVATLFAGGFRSAMPGVFLFPREKAQALRPVVDAVGHDRVAVFTGTREAGPPDGAFVRSLWDVDGLARRYRGFITAWQSDARRKRWRKEEAFAARFALVFSYLEIAWNDPELPLQLLPSGWPGGRARTIARTLYERLLPGALEVSQSLLAPSKRELPA
jgi:phenylacetic acid degradation operon negative regulatory protein